VVVHGVTEHVQNLQTSSPTVYIESLDSAPVVLTRPLVRFADKDPGQVPEIPCDRRSCISRCANAALTLDRR